MKPMNMSREFGSILVGDDGTPEAQEAVDVAFSLAKCCRAKVMLLCVLTGPSAEQQAEGFGLEHVEEDRAALKAKIEQAVEAGRSGGLEVLSALAEGEPEEEIERFVKEHGVDLLVVGHRAVSRPRRWLEGSTSEGLAHRLSVSMLIVHARGG